MTARPRIESPTARASMALVAANSIPGSIEARLVYHCTCAVARHRESLWRPERVAEWQGVICLSCPAHGRLLERYVARAPDNDNVGVLPRSEVQRRSLWVRIGWAIRGWLTW